MKFTKGRLMANKLTIYYSVDNCGDGSAYPILFDTKELAEWHQDHLYEGWGESCTGSIVVEGDHLCCPELETKEGYYLQLLLDEEDGLDEFKSTFFPDGLPKFTVRIIKFNYYGIFVEGRLVYESFAHPEKKANAEGVETLTKLLEVSDD